MLIANGDADWVIDKGEPSVWERTRQVVSQTSNVYRQLGSPGGIRVWFEADGGHRLYFVCRQSPEELGAPEFTVAGWLKRIEH